MLPALLPSGLDPLVALGLVLLSFAASLITATFSLGGGTLMLAVLALVFPPAIVVPVHGAVQLGSNGGRAIVQRRHIQWPLVLWMGIGTVIGTLVGARFTTLIPETAFTVVIALFILVTTWLPQPRLVGTNRLTQVVGAAVISALGMLVGAVGPLVAVFIRGLADRQQLVATHAGLMTIQNSLKVVAFAALGFAFAQYVPLVLAMVIAGFGGTVLGSRLLVKVPEVAFRYGFRVLLTIIALDLLRGVVWG